MNQEVKYINIKDLVLWTENPRDPINENATDQDIVDKALVDSSNKWTLKKLAKEMGEYYDFSELPTVVYHGKTPIVYDGNRRIILGKIKFGLVTVPNSTNIQIPEFPKEIPCNVCEKEIALKNVERKHSKSGSWSPLERDIFLHKFMKKEKSLFLVLDETTGIISNNPHLNKGYVKEEVFKENVLTAMGFSIKDGELQSVHSDQEGYSILSDISQKVKDEVITTRGEQRGKAIEVLDVTSKQIIDKNKDKKPHQAKISFEEPNSQKKLTRRTTPKTLEIFGEKLYLRVGKLSDLYRDVTDLYQYYSKEKYRLSQTFPSIIRMALRLICEAAANDVGQKIEDYVTENYPVAKKEFNQDIKTTLSNQSVTETSIVKLLHTGAHNFTASSNIEQTIALSIAIGGMLKITHGKKE